ncbi:NAD(P)/FAD-dependent oxidoreductase [Nocardioides endophyticus]|uniref:NAD(P)/FAD-dependent oxidoreductase n=1 Tax=Nocardioides endophyticus TaxID=1353775 RepID=UPI0031E79DD9
MTGAAPFVVVGSSLAGLRAVEAARQVGYSGEIVLIGTEHHLPYDRPPLSKKLLEKGSSDGRVTPPHFRDAGYVQDGLQVTVRSGVPAVALDTDGRCVILADGSAVRYGCLVIATGARPRQPFDSAGQLSGVHDFRVHEDSQAVRAGLERGARVAIIGAGLIGSEVASSARTWDAEVTLVEAQEVPLVRALGATVGSAVADLHEENGVRLLLGACVASLEGVGAVEAIRLDVGTRIASDLVVTAIGVDPETDWLRGSGLQLDNGIVCDANLWTGVPGVFAAGDVVSWPNGQFGRQRLETWTSAAEQGAVAAKNALDPATARAYTTTPYFWSDWYGNRLQFVGSPVADEVQWIEGGVGQGRRAVALYRRADRCVGAFALNAPGETMKLRALVGRGTSWPEAIVFAESRARSYLARQ